MDAWVGSGVQAARGVPERFLNPDSKSPKEASTAPPDGEKAVKKELGTDGEQGKVLTKSSTEDAGALTGQPQQSKQPVVQQAPQVAAAK